MRWNRSIPADNEQWHSWFAWYPIVVGTKWVWLEFVLRRYDCDPTIWETWEYRLAR